MASASDDCYILIYRQAETGITTQPFGSKAVDNKVLHTLRIFIVYVLSRKIGTDTHLYVVILWMFWMCVGVLSVCLHQHL